MFAIVTTLMMFMSLTCLTIVSVYDTSRISNIVNQLVDEGTDLIEKLVEEQKPQEPVVEVEAPPAVEVKVTVEDVEVEQTDYHQE